MRILRLEHDSHASGPEDFENAIGTKPADFPSEPDVMADWTLWLELWTRARRDAETARKREALDRRWRGTIADIVREGQRAGEFAALDADDFALRLTALIDGLAVQVLLGDSDVTSERMREICLEVASSELDLEAGRKAKPLPRARRAARAE